MVKVTVPNKHFNGVRAGVEFKHGEAECDSQKANELEALGYTVERSEPVKEEKPKAKQNKPKKAPKKAEG